MEDAITLAVRQIIREEVAKAIEEHRVSLRDPTLPVAESSSPGRLLFVEEVADILRRSPAQIRWMLHNGTAPHHAKIGGRVVFKEEDVYLYIEAAFAPTD